MNQNINQILHDAGFDINVIQGIHTAYAQPYRHYHNIRHINNMLNFIYNNSSIKEFYSGNVLQALKLAIIYHDVVYDPQSKTNEEDSYNYFLNDFGSLPNHIKYDIKWETMMPLIQKMIMATKDHEIKDKSDPIKQIILADLDGFNQPFEDFWQDTKNILKEYSCFDWGELKNGRIKFLEEYTPKIENILGTKAGDNCRLSAIMLKTWQPKIGIYPGSFCPMHAGHIDILRKAEEIFDKVILVVAKNPDKPDRTPKIPRSVETTHQIDRLEPLVLLTDYIKSKSYPVTVIRGLRNATDLQSEITQYRYYQDMMPGIQLVNIFCDAKYEHISSSGIRSIKPYFEQKEQLTGYEII